MGKGLGLRSAGSTSETGWFGANIGGFGAQIGRLGVEIVRFSDKVLDFARFDSFCMKQSYRQCDYWKSCNTTANMRLVGPRLTLNADLP